MLIQLKLKMRCLLSISLIQILIIVAAFSQVTSGTSRSLFHSVRCWRAYLRDGQMLRRCQTILMIPQRYKKYGLVTGKLLLVS